MQVGISVELNLVSLQFPLDRRQRDRIPVHLCKRAVANHHLDVFRSRQRHCNTSIASHQEKGRYILECKRAFTDPERNLSSGN